MYFCVDYENLSKTGHSFQSKTFELDTLYSDILKICKEIDENWKTEDSTVYLGRMQKFVSDTLDRNEVLHSCGNTLSKIAFLYNVQDNKWANEIMKSDLMVKRDDLSEL